MTALGVAVAEGSSLEFSLAQQAVWASLPMSLHASPGDPRLVAVDGRADGWVDALATAVGSGVAGVLVVRPSSGAASTAVRAIAVEAAERHVAVVVETAWASHPAVVEFARTLAPRVGEAALVDSVALVPEGDAAGLLLDQLALVRAASVPLEAVRFAAGTAHGYSIQGGTTAPLFALAAVRSGSAAHITLTVYGATSQAHLSVVAGGTAAPALAWLVDADGRSVQPSVYESAARASWRRLRDAVGARTALPDLADLCADLDTVAALSPIR